MKISSIGFIGGGRVARILLEGWSRANALPSQIIVSDPNAATLASLKQQFPGIEITTDAREAAVQDLVFLATHPAALADAARPLAVSLKPTAIVVSLAPKFTIASLTALLRGFARIARANPNAASVIGMGMNPIAYGAGLPDEARSAVRSLFAPLGANPEVAEEKIEGYAVFTAMGPTYLWFQLQALRELAVSFGLSQSEADAGLKQMVQGAVATLVDSGLQPSVVMDLVPVKPLAEMEPGVTELYRSRLTALHQKIKP